MEERRQREKGKDGGKKEEIGDRERRLVEESRGRGREGR